ncbi:energy-coupled thiamine transporter ThiT [Bacillus sp. 165]|uniref:energy-coupled thiamine transporter ThiT n=1 Tax=Bacillus sp. 165 TaxID=1529117 RepID=UPI001ADCFDD3|nr:energy-coupled thiamine transporter ThiT [Bacillus sp. 165]MBO9131461.1 energy-coupled thiamine transporter ThiT [Bacillus sp. 165]
MGNKRIQFLIETAMCSALAIILDTVPFFSFKLWAQGGSVSFAMIPVFLMAFRWGWKGGLANGLMFGILQVVTQAYIVHPVQGFIDYFFAFTALGFAGVFSNKIKQAFAAGNNKKTILYISLGVLLGSALRFLAHFTAGIIFFAEFAPKGQPVALYSLVYNASYMVPAAILSAVILSFMLTTSPRLVRVTKPA